MRYTFRDKLLLSFAALLVVTVVPVLVLVNTQIETLSVRKIALDLENTKAVFRRFQEARLASSLEKATTFILTQPGIRAEIATSAVGQDDVLGEAFGSGEADDPFAALAKPAPAGRGQAPPGSPPPRAAPLSDPQDDRAGRIQSVVQEVGLFNESDVFFLADFQGRLVFSKASPRAAGGDLTGLSAIVGALQGNDIFTWWGAREARLADAGLLPADQPAALYQVFLKPIQFGGEVKGVMGIGLAVTPPVLAEITGITQSELAFISGGVAYANSLPDIPGARLVQLAAQSAADRSTAMVPFSHGGEEFLALPVPVSSSLGEPLGQVIVYRSKTREKRVFDNLRLILNGIGAAALIVAGLLAFFISTSVSQAVRILSRAVSEVRNGNLAHVVEVRSRDEFGDLEHAFNEMTAGLREKEAIRDTFKRYVSSSVVDELLHNLGEIKLGGENKQLTIQFSDIAGFTSLSEAMAPEQVVEFLNAYLSEMTQEVEAQQGIVDKYIGDAVMAFWGSPLPLENHALCACRAALGQIRKVDALRRSWAQQGALGNFDIRIGLHTGDVIVGNIGSATRMDYTVIGDTVNTASRLEGMNKVYGTRILISEQTHALVREHLAAREVDRIRPVGKTEPIGIHELVGERGAVDAGLAEVHARFAEALALYRAARFAEAGSAFAALAESSGDRPSRAFARRCEEYIAHPPAAPWDGVFAPREK
jgi:class 3 adenylate cyclase